MKKIILQFLFFAPMLLKAQTDTGKGVHFQKGLNWEQIKAKAKAENKYIFMDCYTTWCAPCRYMSQKIFPHQAVGDFMNAHFINVAVQMDQTLHDQDAVKKWYTDAKVIEKAFGIAAYPTYLFFSPDGQAVHHLVGGFSEQEFIDNAEDALISAKQYYPHINSYKDHRRDSIFLRDALTIAEKQYDSFNAAAIGKCYLDCLKNPFTKENLNLLIQSIQSSSDKVFQFLLQNIVKIDAVAGSTNISVKPTLSRIIAQTEVDPLLGKEDTVLNWKEISYHLKCKYHELGNTVLLYPLGHFKGAIESAINKMIYKDGAPAPDWTEITRSVRQRFRGFDFTQIIMEKKPEYYSRKESWFECARSALALLRQYGDKMGGRELNNIVWDYMFSHDSNQKDLKEVLPWSKHSIDLSPHTYQNLDTYANLLYKIGDRQSALLWEKKAISICDLSNDPEGLKDLTDNLEKMQRNEKTWIDPD